MARKRPSTHKRQREYQKRQRELDKAKKAAEKRERRQNREASGDTSPPDDGEVASSPGSDTGEVASRPDGETPGPVE